MKSMYLIFCVIAFISCQLGVKQDAQSITVQNQVKTE